MDLNHTIHMTDSHGNKRWKRKKIKKAWTGVTTSFSLPSVSWVSERWDLKIWGQRRRQKRHEFAFFQSSWRLFQSSYLSKCMQAPLELNYQEPHPSLERQRNFRRRLFTSSIVRENRHFHVVVVQQRQKNVQKRLLHVLSFCSAY